MAFLDVVVPSLFFQANHSLMVTLGNPKGPLPETEEHTISNN